MSLEPEDIFPPEDIWGSLSLAHVHHPPLGAPSINSFFCILQEITYVFINCSKLDILTVPCTCLYIRNRTSSFFSKLAYFSIVTCYIFQRASQVTQW